mgnify:CR=1 FL=1
MSDKKTADKNGFDRRRNKTETGNERKGDVGYG